MHALGLVGGVAGAAILLALAANRATLGTVAALGVYALCFMAMLACSAAYNMGYEQLLNRIDRAGTTDFNELVRQGALPTETSRYVPKILAAAIVANNLERFNFDEVHVASPVDGGEIAVPPRTSLETLARAAGVSTSIIRKMNPDILGKELPPGKGDFLVTVPAESLSRAAAALPSMIRRQNDSGGVDNILDPLDLMNPDGFHPVASDDDQNLLALLPRAKKKRHTFRDPSLDDLGPSDDGPAETADRDDEPKPRKGRETLIYRVGAGDTLIGVARQFAMDVDDVARENKLKPDAELREGGLLKLKVKKDLIQVDTSKTEAKRERDHEPGKRSSTKG